jgi:hypothetical protein
VEFRRGQLLLQVVVQNLRQAPALAVLRLRQLQRQLLKLAGPMLQLLERLLPLGDIFQVEHEKLHVALLIQQRRQQPIPIRDPLRGIRKKASRRRYGCLVQRPARRSADFVEDRGEYRGTPVLAMALAYAALTRTKLK